MADSLVTYGLPALFGVAAASIYYQTKRGPRVLIKNQLEVPRDTPDYWRDRLATNPKTWDRDLHQYYPAYQEFYTEDGVIIPPWLPSTGSVTIPSPGFSRMGSNDWASYEQVNRMRRGVFGDVNKLPASRFGF